MICVKNLNKRFGSREVLRNVSFEIGEGVCGLIGKNGAGKTTLLRMIAGVYDIKGGEITLNGKKISKADVGYVPQEYGLFEDARLIDMIEYMASLMKVKGDIKEEAKRVLDLVNLYDRRNDKIRKLSGGMKRRAAIAQGILGNPPVILFDEPTTGLDFDEKDAFYDFIRKISSDHIIIISTHMREDIQAVCTDSLLLTDGEIKHND